jgi:hypothetical protein
MKQGLTDITIVLDRSGSMADIATDTIGGFNTFVEQQQLAPGDANLSLRQFDDKHDVVYSVMPIKYVPKLTAQTFMPRGSTALLDAIGMAITDIGARLTAVPESERPEKVIVVIITDGLENASSKFTRNQVFQMITHQQEVYKWAFTFIGASQDAIAEAGALGIHKISALNYAKSGKGANNAFAAASAGAVRMRQGQTSVMSYTVDEQTAAMEEDDAESGV